MFLTKPAITYVTNEIPATVKAYGSCVETWLMWSDCAPADAIMVVSEIGEQWSPQTAPAIQAEIAMIVMFESNPPNAAITIGIRIPNVPHDVPVAKEIPTAIRKITAGRRLINAPAVPLTIHSMKLVALRLSVIALRVHAQTRIRIAGTIALNPS